MGHQRLRARLRRVPPARWSIGRPTRPPAHLHVGDDPVHGRVAPLRPRLERGVLIAFRALQGLGAATITPAALSILVATFAEGRERNIALGAWGAVGGFGAAAGVLFGGILTDLLSWEWIFFVRSVGVVALILTPFLLSESLDKHGQGFDALGAILVTSGLSLLVLGITQGHRWGWTSAETIGVFAASAVLLLAFIGWEQRARDPLVPFSIFRLQTLTAANVVGFILGTALSQCSSC